MISGNALFQKLFTPRKQVLNEMEGRTVHFWDLPKSARFVLEKDFCNALFEKAAHGDYYNLAKDLGISYPYIHPLRRLIYSIPRDLLIKIAGIANIELILVEEKICFVRTRAGGKVSIKFPIEGNSEIAALVGHVFGDSSISAKKRQFEYSNNNPVLLLEVKCRIKKVFGIDPYTKKATRIIYPSIVGDILLMFGAPLAPKLYTKTVVPEWILDGPENYRREFLRAIFDDDGSVMYSKGFNAKGVNFYQTRHESRREELGIFLLQVKQMLAGFDIICGRPLISREYQKEDGTHIVMYINITNYRSIRNFADKIGLTEGEKLSKLKIIANKGGIKLVNPQKVLVLGSGALKIGEAGESALGC